MLTLTRKRGARLGALVAVTCMGLAAGCGSSAPSGSSGGGASGNSSAGTASSGTASVAYAASLAYLNEKVVGPAFEKSTGLSYTGRAGPSDGLSAEIAAKEIAPDAFETVGGASIEALFGKFTSWYVQYATTSIVVAYNPHSKYASQFRAIASGREPVRDLFTLMEEPGFRLGRTDPNTDPQGRAFIFMLELAAKKYHLPANTVSKIIGSPANSARSPQIFEEAALDSTLQSGQLDAASAYLSQARQLHLSYITLPPDINLGDAADAAQYKKASITITSTSGQTTKTGSPLTIDITAIGNSASGIKWVDYVLSPAGLALHKQGGYTLLKPTVTGTGVPASVQSELGG
ncbi:MAG TPA: extracellular solute-binding protein [Streptosporangiaceae bacterium]|nr:extracellular solute-binding protein [Streptosporangiaceae bacterium]